MYKIEIGKKKSDFFEWQKGIKIPHLDFQATDLCKSEKSFKFPKWKDWKESDGIVIANFCRMSVVL